MRPSTTARRYAEAAYQVAHEDGQVEQWLQSLAQVAGAVSRPEVAGYFKDPNVPRDEKLAMTGTIAGDAPEGVRNLLRILAGLGRLHLVPAILQEMRDLHREAQGVREASITVARPLSSAESTEIAERLTQAIGAKVEIHTRVDPEILGGIVVRLGDRLVDASVKGRLDRLRNQLAS